MKKASYTAKRSPQKSPKKSLLMVGALILIAAIVGLLEITNTTHFFHQGKAESGSITKASPNNAPDKVGSTKISRPATNSTSAVSPSTKPSAKTSDPAISGNGVSGPLTTPYGNFVSNHSPGDDDSPSNAETSICITSPGASCAITFTKQDGTDAGVVKTLDAGIADSTGTVYWNWDVKGAGFTTGNWKIKAQATLNGQTASAEDQIPLKIK